MHHERQYVRPHTQHTGAAPGTALTRGPLPAWQRCSVPSCRQFRTGWLAGSPHWRPQLLSSGRRWMALCFLPAPWPWGPGAQYLPAETRPRAAAVLRRFHHTCWILVRSPCIKQSKPQRWHNSSASKMVWPSEFHYCPATITSLREHLYLGVYLTLE